MGMRIADQVEQSPAPTGAQDHDAHLLQRVARGDRGALATLYERHHRPLFTFLLQHTRDHGLAEELLQDTFVAVWRGAAGFDAQFREGTASVRAWLTGIARRQSHNTLRRLRLPLADISALDDMAAPDPEPEAWTLTLSTRDELLDAFERLPLHYREIAVLALVQDYSYAEMAAILDVPLGTVKSRLAAAKSLLRTLLAPGKEERDGSR